MAPKTKTIANLGQAKLLELKITLGALAACCEVSRAAAQSWRDGVKKPDTQNRSRIARRWPELEEHLWDMRPASAAEAAPPPRSPPSVESSADEVDKDVKTLARDHLAHVRRLREDAAAGGKAGEHIKLLDLERKTIMDLAKFSGELTAADENKLTDTARWKQIRQRIAETLSPYPDAARAVVAALQELGA